MTDKIDKALEYHRMIAPLLAPGLEQAERRALREHVLLTENIHMLGIILLLILCP